MHDDELRIDEALVHALVRERLPDLVDLQIERVVSAGTDNALFRLGGELVVRLPRIGSAALPIEKEHTWLPRLASSLPLAVPEPVALGEPALGYPWRWSVYRWIAGEPLGTPADVRDPASFATALASFVVALEAIDASDGPAPGEHNAWRGCALDDRDEEMREALEACRGVHGLDIDAMTRAWDEALRVPRWSGQPVWVHGDLLPTNVLVAGGQPTAVLDFGCLGVGEPSCDVMPAWTTIPREGRDAYREGLRVDGATWARGRGWALSWAAIALPYYIRTNPTLADLARRTIDEVLADRDP